LGPGKLDLVESERLEEPTYRRLSA
jgi:hypothetical protein